MRPTGARLGGDAGNERDQFIYTRRYGHDRRPSEAAKAMNDIWEEVWGTINETFQRIAVSLGACYPDLFWSSGHSDNKAFPFRAYAAFAQGSQRSEDVVASVDFHSSEYELRYSADIGRDDGMVLADGPAGIIDVSGGIVSAQVEIEAVVDAIVGFLEASERVIRDAITSPAGG